jgi:hypothetical protein
MMTTKRPGKSRWRGTKWVTVVAGVGLFALVLAGVGFAGGQANEGSGGGGDAGVLVLERRQVIFVSGNGGVTTSALQVQQAPASPPKTVTKTKPAKKSRGS